MTDQNPYAAPDAVLDTDTPELYQPSIFSFSGRIGRLRYLAYSFSMVILMMVVMMVVMMAMGAGFGATTATNGNMPIIGIVFSGFLGIAIFVLAIMFVKRRLNDLNRSGWWFLLNFIPIVSLILAIYLMLFPGTEGTNSFGPAPAANALGIKILAWVLPVIFILGIVTAVAIPAYQEYMMRVQ